MERMSIATEALDLVKLTALMELTSGDSDVVVGLIDGPVLTDHLDLASEKVRTLPGKAEGKCTRPDNAACAHGTFVAGILCARRDSTAPAICPGCTLLVRPIFPDTTHEPPPSATPDELAAAIIECVDAGARLVNLSAALVQLPSSREERALEILWIMRQDAAHWLWQQPAIKEVLEALS